MPEALQTTSDEAGVTRTPTGTIADLSPTSTPPSQETIVRPPPTPSTPQETKTETKSEAKPDAKPAEARKSLLNEKSEGPKGAPEKYEDFKVPEGYTLDKGVAERAIAVFKDPDVNASQAGAQKLVDLFHELTREAFQQPYDAYNELRQKWRDEVNGDPEIGGSKLHGTRVSVGRLLDSLGDSKLADSFRAEMDMTGLGDHPVVVKVLARIAQRLTEGGAVRGNGPSVEGQRAPGEGRPSAAQALYPNLPTRG